MSQIRGYEKISSNNRKDSDLHRRQIHPPRKTLCSKFGSPVLLCHMKLSHEVGSNFFFSRKLATRFKPQLEAAFSLLFSDVERTILT